MPSKYGGTAVSQEEILAQIQGEQSAEKPMQGSYGGQPVEPEVLPDMQEFIDWQAQSETPIDQEDSKKRTFGQEIGRQLALTGRAAAEGTAGALGVFVDPLSLAMNQVLPKGYKIPTMYSWARDTLTNAGVPNPEGKAEEVVQEISQALAGGMLSAGVSSSVAKGATGLTGKVASELAAEPAREMMSAAGGAAGQQLAKELGAGPIGQFGASVVGATLGGGMGSTPTKREVLPGSKEAEALGVDVMTSDIMPPRTSMGKWLQSWGEKTFLGTGGKRVEQYAQREKAVKNVLDEFGASDYSKAIDNTMVDLLNTQGKFVKKWSDMKNGVIERLNEKGVVDVTKSIAKIDSEIDRLKRAFPEGGMEDLLKLLEQYKGNIKNQSLVNIELNREQIGNALGRQDMGHIKKEGQKVTKAVYDVLREEMGDFIKKVGDKQDFTKWKVANKKLSDNIIELEKTTLKSILNKGTIDPAKIRTMLFNKSPAQNRLIYKRLSPEGKANARIAVLGEAISKSGGFDNINPQRFATNIKKLSQQVGIYFGKSDYDKLKGLERVLDLTKRAAEAGVMTPTGLQAAPAVNAQVLKNMVGTWFNAMTTGGTIGVAARLYESPAVSKILSKLPKLKRGSNEEAAVVESLMNTLRDQLEPEQEEKYYEGLGTITQQQEQTQ